MNFILCFIILQWSAVLTALGNSAINNTSFGATIYIGNHYLQIMVPASMSAGQLSQEICEVNMELALTIGPMHHCLQTVAEALLQSKNELNDDAVYPLRVDKSLRSKEDSICSFKHTHFDLEVDWAIASSSIDAMHANNQKVSTMYSFRSINRGAIVMLWKLDDARIERGLKNVDLLYKNFNEQFKEDIWIFHEGDFNITVQNYIRQGRKEIRFYQIDLNDGDIRPKVPPTSEHTVWGSWSWGYRRMCRFFAIELWPLMHRMGYTWVLRLDDDSSILSPINFNLFSFMEANHFHYAYRIIGRVTPLLHEETVDIFWDAVQSYLITESIDSPGQLFDTCINQNSIRHFNRSNCGLMPGFYNNFFLTNVSWWLQDDVQKLLQFIDDLDLIHWYGMGDLTVQSLVVRILLPESQLYRFTSFTYAHTGLVHYNGIIQTGILDPHPLQTIQSFVELFQDEYSDLEYKKYLTLHQASGIWSLSSTYCHPEDVNATQCYC